MPGLSCSSLATVVPSLLAIVASVSPDWIVYLRTCCRLRPVPGGFFVVFAVTVGVGCFAW